MDIYNGNCNGTDRGHLKRGLLYRGLDILTQYRSECHRVNTQLKMAAAGDIQKWKFEAERRKLSEELATMRLALSAERNRAMKAELRHFDLSQKVLKLEVDIIQSRRAIEEKDEALSAERQKVTKAEKRLRKSKIATEKANKENYEARFAERVKVAKSEMRANKLENELKKSRLATDEANKDKDAALVTLIEMREKVKFQLS